MRLHQKTAFLFFLSAIFYLAGCTTISEVSPPSTDDSTQQNQEIKGVETYLFEADISFEFDKSDLKEEFKPYLQEILNQTELSNKHILIVGHTDDVGPFDVNVFISEQRAISVENYFLNNGVDKSNLSTLGLGMLYPLEENKSKESRQKNRRVKIHIISQDQKDSYLASFDEKKIKLNEAKEAFAKNQPKENSNAAKESNAKPTEQPSQESTTKQQVTATQSSRVTFNTSTTNSDQKAKITFPKAKEINVLTSYDRTFPDSVILPLDLYPSDSEKKYFQRLTYIYSNFLKTNQIGKSHKSYLAFWLTADKNDYPYMFKINMSYLRLLNNRKFSAEDLRELKEDEFIYPLKSILRRGYFVNSDNQKLENLTNRYINFLNQDNSLPALEKSVEDQFKNR